MLTNTLGYEMNTTSRPRSVNNGANRSEVVAMWMSLTQTNYIATRKHMKGIESSAKLLGIKIDGLID